MLVSIGLQSKAKKNVTKRATVLFIEKYLFFVKQYFNRCWECGWMQWQQHYQSNFVIYFVLCCCIEIFCCCFVVHQQELKMNRHQGNFFRLFQLFLKILFYFWQHTVSRKRFVVCECWFDFSANSPSLSDHLSLVKIYRKSIFLFRLMFDVSFRNCSMCCSSTKYSNLLKILQNLCSSIFRKLLIGALPAYVTICVLPGAKG